MSNPCIWLIQIDQDEYPVQAAASQLQSYGIPIKRQYWQTQEQAWLASAEEATKANAAVVLLVGTAASYVQPALRRSLALFRLSLQTRLGRWVNGYTLLSGNSDEPQAQLPGTAVLADWIVPESSAWQAQVVARAYAPVAPVWPVRLGLHAHERLGIWLESHPDPGQMSEGALVGVSGGKIDFHAVGPAGGLPERSINQYELQGLEFESAGFAFNAWGLRNSLTPEQSYYTRLDGEPDMLAIGRLPEGEPDHVCLMSLG